MRYKVSNYGRWPAALSIPLSGVLIAIATGVVPALFPAGDRMGADSRGVAAGAPAAISLYAAHALAELRLRSARNKPRAYPVSATPLATNTLRDQLIMFRDIWKFSPISALVSEVTRWASGVRASVDCRMPVD
jgi:hypothetical protein